MSWSVTIDDIDSIPEDIPEGLHAVFAKLGEDNPAYTRDAEFLFATARAAGLVSCTLSGGRTPSPYGGPDSVVLAIVGFDSRAEGKAVAKSLPSPGFYNQMRATILSGPDTPEEE